MQYYTLEEAARLLGTTPDDVKKMAERNELRPFRDRGSMRFRSQEVEELARRRGRGSDPELPLGEAPTPRKSKVEGPASGIGRKGKSEGPASGVGRKSKIEKPKDAPEVFDFDLPIEDDQVEIGQELKLSPGPSSSAARSKNKLSGPKSPPPTPGSDSDVRLVGDSGAELDFQLASDSDVKLVDSPGPKSSPSLSGPKSASRMSKPPSTRKDSSVRMVPMDEDSKVRLEGGTGRSGALNKSPSDSDVRLDQGGSSRKSKLGEKKQDDMLLTEEIDLDAELQKAAEASKSKLPRVKPGSTPQLPTTSPFELSEADLGLDDPSGLKDSSSDFDLTPAKQDNSPLELGSDELSLPLSTDSSEDEVSLGELNAGSGESGINLRDPADSGISLEQQGSEEEIEFELSLDEGTGSTPRPAPAAAKEEVDSDSEFELTLDSSPSEPSSSETEPAPSDSEFELNVDSSSSEGDSDSEFELTLDDSTEKPLVDSDSEFELTLDDSGNMPALQEEAGLEVEEGEKDIFETDFEVPALEDESGSQAMALDEDSSDSGDIESSDFDLDIGEGMADDESGSQVLALDEDSEEADGAAATVARPGRSAGAAVLDEDEAEELLEEDMDFDADAAASGRKSGAGVAVAAPPAEWGAMPAMVMGVCVIVMFLVGLMGFELVRGMYGYRQGGPVTSLIIDPLARMFTDDLPK